MQLFLRIDQNIASFVLLGCVCLIALERLDRRDRLNRIFFRLSAIILVQLAMETVTALLNGRPGWWMNVLQNLLHVLLFILGPILSCISFYLIKQLIEPDRMRGRTAQLLFVLPIGLNLVFTLLSPWLGLAFTIGPGNVYTRGPLFPLTAVLTYFYMLCGLALVLLHRKTLLRQEFAPLLLFCLMPLSGGMVQTLFYGVLYIWSSAACALVIVYIFLQQRMVQLDPLTGALTRGSFAHHIAKRLRQKRPERVGMIYLDMDGLKSINDEYGHAEGDQAIKSAISIISGAVRGNDIVARMGGDEFVVLMDCRSLQELERTAERIEQAFRDFNESSGKDYRLECSYGADFMKPGETEMEDFFLRVDKLMYEHKRRKREGEF